MLRKFTTIVRAINPVTGELTSYEGPTIEAISWRLADEYCQTHGLGYCKVDGELVMSIPCKEGTLLPDWSKAVDYSIIQNN